MAVQSLPPDAQREPSGETVTVLRYPVWPTSLVRSLQLLRFHTLTTLSQPHETMRGLLADGEKRTQLTHSVWPSSWMVYLHSPSVFHSLMDLSREPDTICRLSAENATASTSFSWDTKRRVVAPVLMSQSRRVPSQLPERANCPSEEIVTSWT